ncbi:SF1 [Mytilus coruscus]|uniref:SF1 n=1 Tax=Mytilus coruscus TaxID=42192 RepID=A0A6J8D871_MYTCO|nr:SF1 [Mytilus coruscus]
MLNRVVVTKYFEDLEKVITDNHLKAAHIWNMDETGKQFEHNPTNVCARKGSWNVPGRTSNSRENVTILASVNAEGNVMPPISHEVLGLLEEACNENIIVFALPPHCTHMLQPLDRTVFGPFSKAYDRECTEFLSKHPNNDINKQTWPRVFKTAWEAALTVDNIKNGFLACGICPFDASVIPDSAFLPSDPFDVPLPVNENNSNSFPATETQAIVTVASDSNLDISVNESTVRNDEFLPVVISTPSNDEIEVLQPAFSPIAEIRNIDDGFPTLDQVPLLLMALGNDEVQLEEIPATQDLVLSNDDNDGVQLETLNTELGNVEGITEVNTLKRSITNSDHWNMDVESIFGLATASSEKKKKLRKSSSLTSHRILTSEEVMREKRMKEAEKEKLVFEKEKRKEIRQMKRESHFTSAGQQSWGSGSSGSPGPGQTEGSDKKKKRKSRWAQDSEMEKTVIPGLPTVIPTGLSSDQEKQYLMQLQIEEISRRLRTGDLGIPPNPESRFDFCNIDDFDTGFSHW